MVGEVFVYCLDGCLVELSFFDFVNDVIDGGLVVYCVGVYYYVFVYYD